VSVAKFALLHTRTGCHVGGRSDNGRDVLSWKAQRRGGFRCHSIFDRTPDRYNCMEDPTSPVWRYLLADHGREPVASHVTFRMDRSRYLMQQHDRTRTAIAMLAAGHRRSDVADALGTTRSAVTQRMATAEREWGRFEESGEC